MRTALDYIDGRLFDNNLTLNVWADNVSAVGFYESLGMKIQKIGMEKIL